MANPDAKAESQFEKQWGLPSWMILLKSGFGPMLGGRSSEDDAKL